jgi:hypothetical protein
MNDSPRQNPAYRLSWFKLNIKQPNNKQLGKPAIRAFKKTIVLDKKV